MSGARIDFSTADAAGFNALRDQWRSTAVSWKCPVRRCSLSRAGLRVATVLPTFLNREYGYAFPTDEDLAGAIGADTKTAKRGLTALDEAELIQRVTTTKRDEKGEAVGRARRIYLTLPEVKGQEVKGQPNVKGQKPRGEGTYGVPYILDRTTPDKKERRLEEKVSKVSPTHVPGREGEPPVYRGDNEFLDAFDKTLMELTDGLPIGAGEFETILQQAFDLATDSSDMFMPLRWADICATRTGETAAWFRRRAGQLVHRRAAAA